MDLKAVIFDIDGTVAETEEAHRSAFNGAFSAAGLCWLWDEALYRRLLSISGGRERIAHYIEAHDPPGPVEGPAPDWIARLHADKTGRFQDMLAAGGLPARPGVIRLAEELRAANVRLAIATTTSRANAAAVINSALGDGALSWFEVVGAGEDAGPKKPDPEVYIHVLERLSLPPEACVAIEDSANGLKAALAAGIPTVIAENAYTTGQDFSGAAAHLSDLGEPGSPFIQFSGPRAEKGYADAGQLRRWRVQAF